MATAEQTNLPGQFWHFGETKHVHVVPLQSATSQSSGALHQHSNHQVLSHRTQTILFQPGSISGVNESLSNTDFNSSSQSSKTPPQKPKTQTAASIALAESPICWVDSPTLCLSTTFLSDGKEGHLPPLYHPSGTSQPFPLLSTWLS